MDVPGRAEWGDRSFAQWPHATSSATCGCTGAHEWFEAGPDALIDARTAKQTLGQLALKAPDCCDADLGELGFTQIAAIMQLSISTVHGRYTAHWGGCANDWRSHAGTRLKPGPARAGRGVEISASGKWNDRSGRRGVLAQEKALTRRQVHLWQSITGVFLLIAAGTWMLPPRHADVSPSDHFHGGTLALEPQTAHPQTWSSQSVLMLQESMWKNGMDDFPSTQLPDVKPMHADALAVRTPGATRVCNPCRRVRFHIRNFKF